MRNWLLSIFSLLLSVSLYACGEDAPDGNNTGADFGLGDWSDGPAEVDPGEDVVDMGADDLADTAVEDQPRVDLDVGDDTPPEDGIEVVDTTEPDAADLQLDIPDEMSDMSELRDTDSGSDLAGDPDLEAEADLAVDLSEMDTGTPRTSVLLAFGELQTEDFGRATLEITIDNPVSVGGFKFTTTGIEWDNHEAAFGGRAAEKGFSFFEDYPKRTITGYSEDGTALLPPTTGPVVLLKVRFEYPPSVDETCLEGVLINDESGPALESEVGPCYCFSESCE